MFGHKLNSVKVCSERNVIFNVILHRWSKDNRLIIVTCQVAIGINKLLVLN